MGYLLVHMYGNLKFFQGPEKFDSYLEGLDDILYPYLPHEGALWIIRIDPTVTASPATPLIKPAVRMPRLSVP